MNSNERMLKTLNHQEPDVLPFDLGSTKVTGITKGAYISLLKSLEIKNKDKHLSNIEIIDRIQQLVKLPEEILRKLKIDTRGVFSQTSCEFKPEIKENESNFEFIDEWGIKWRMPKSKKLYYDMISHPLSNVSSTNELDKYNWPDPMNSGRFKKIKQAINSQSLENKPLILGGSYAPGFLEIGTRLRGFENFFLDLGYNQSFVHYFLDSILELKKRFWKKVSEISRDKFLVIYQSDDYGSQNNLLISPEHYKKYFKPRQKKLFTYIKDLFPKSYIFLHSCGSIRKIIPDLIEVGIDILNPVQITAKDMNPEDLKKEFGNELVFWGGGIDTQKILPYSNPDEIKKHVKKQIEIFAPGGGFVFSSIHNIQSDIPPENLIAFLNALEENRKY